MSTKHNWTEHDDILALYLYKFKGQEDIPYSQEHIASHIGVSVGSLVRAILNFEAIAGGKGFRNYAKHQVDTYKKYGDKPKEEIRIIVLKILAKE